MGRLTGPVIELRTNFASRLAAIETATIDAG
jgi:hypothetical protein